MTMYAVSLPPRRSRSSSEASPFGTGTVTPWTYVEQTPRTVTQELPQPAPAVIQLQPLRKNSLAESGTTKVSRRRVQNERPEGLGWLVVLPPLVITLLTAGLATTFFLYLAIRRNGDEPSFEHGFYVDEITMNGNEGSEGLLGLLASTIITNVIWVLAFPILVSTAAYCVAGLWLSYQQRPRSERPNLLTPLQYGLLFKLFSAPSPSSLYQVGSYIANRRSRVATPAFFTTAFVLLAGLFGLTALISVADVWLHAAAAVVVMTPSLSPAPSSQSPASVPPSPELLLRSGSSPQPFPILRGHYPLAPAITYILLLYAHSILAAALTLWTATLRSVRLPSSRDEEENGTTTYPPAPVPTALRLAHLHLTDGLAPVAARLSGRRLPLAAHTHPFGQGMFVEDVNSARVEVGFWEPDRERRKGRASGERVFGVYKKVVAFKGEIY